MKIVLVSYFPRDLDKPRGGVETATLGLARALEKSGAGEVHVVTLEKRVTALERETSEGIEVHRLPQNRWPLIVDAFCGPSTRRLRAYLRVLQPDIVHFQETWGFGSADCGFPSVFTVHGFDSLNLPAEKKPGWRVRSLLWRVAEWWGFRSQKTIVSIAPYVTRRVETQTKAEIIDIWNCLNRRCFEIERKEKKGSVLFIGWINPRKNPLTLVRAAAILKKHHPEAHIHLCGEESDPEYAQELREEIVRLDVGDCVTLHGRLPQTGIMAQIQEASVLVLPSLQENAPMVIAEAMAVGVPVIASNRCGIPDMLTDGVSGFLVEPHDAEGIAARIGGLLDDDGLRAKVGAAAREEAYRKYHPESVATATLNVYERAIAGARQTQVLSSKQSEAAGI